MSAIHSGQTDVEASVPPPEEAHFDPNLKAWALSRYADVVAALQDSRLVPVGYSSDGSQSRVRARTRNVLAPAQLRAWQSKLEVLAPQVADALPGAGSVDLIGDFAEPWCFEAACLVTGADPGNRRALDLAREISACAADPELADRKAVAAAASLELERFIPERLPMAVPAFVALAQTLPAFLANAWLALLRHPVELRRLRLNPDMMHSAIEELLRYAGVARVMFRVAKEDVQIGNVLLPAGDRVALLLRSANRDATRFPDPNRLDLTRRAPRHLAFGTGPHSCVGASLIRMAASVATATFVERFHDAVLCGPIEWRGGVGGFRTPVALRVGKERA